MRDYSGPLLDRMVSPDEFGPEAEQLPCEANGYGFAHSGAIHLTISAICMGRRVRLIRRKMTPTHDEVPGEITGRVIGSSHQFGGLITLGLELDSGECVGVDVSDPGAWAWEVTDG